MKKNEHTAIQCRAHTVAKTYEEEACARRTAASERNMARIAACASASASIDLCAHVCQTAVKA